MSLLPSSNPADYSRIFQEEAAYDLTATALVLIDLQRASASRQHGLGRLLEAADMMDEGRWRFDRMEQVVLPNVRRLLESIRQRSGAVCHVALGSGQDDFGDVPAYLRRLVASTDNRIGRPNHRFLAEAEPHPGEIVVRKSTADAFLGTDLDEKLRVRGVSTVLLAGVSTNSCVESTARHAADLGYQVIVIEDACAAANEDLHGASLCNLARFFATVQSTSEVLEHLER